MPEQAPQLVTPAAPAHPALPPLTCAILALCTSIYAFWNLADGEAYHREVTQFLVPRCFAIWDGAYWGLLTAPFVHIEIFHLLFNMWWCKDFGSLMEPRMGRLRFLGFVLVTAAASAGAQLAVSDQTGIGFSGVVYAMFGYCLACRDAVPLYRVIVNATTVRWLLGWLVLCIVLSQAGIWNIANGAHVAGFLSGYALGQLRADTRLRIPASAVLVALLSLTVAALFWMPWSQAWRNRDGIGSLLALRARATAGDPEAQFQFGEVLLLHGQSREAVDWLERAAKADHLPAMNALAWLYATHPSEAVRSGTQALRWAKRLCDLDGRRTPHYLDTLAASLAEGGAWEEAVETQREAISLLDRNRPGAEDVAGYTRRLRLYQNRKAYREDSGR